MPENIVFQQSLQKQEKYLPSKIETIWWFEKFFSQKKGSLYRINSLLFEKTILLLKNSMIGFPFIKIMKLILM